MVADGSDGVNRCALPNRAACHPPAWRPATRTKKEGKMDPKAKKTPGRADFSKRRSSSVSSTRRPRQSHALGEK